MLDYVDFSEPNESIDNYVGTPEIMTESKIDKLVWKEKPPKKHEKRMEKDFGVFKGFPIKDFMSTNPPKKWVGRSYGRINVIGQFTTNR